MLAAVAALLLNLWLVWAGTWSVSKMVTLWMRAPTMILLTPSSINVGLDPAEAAITAARSHAARNGVKNLEYIQG